MKDRIRQIRKELHLKQAEFGEKIGVKGNTIGNYELGLRNPSDAVIFSICREFDINENWLRTGTGEMFIPKTANQQITDFITSVIREESSSFKKHFITTLATLNDDEWQLLEKIFGTNKKN